MARPRVSKTVTVGDLKFKPMAGRQRSTSEGIERYWQARRYVGIVDGKPRRDTVWRGWARADQLPAVAAGLDREPEQAPEGPPARSTSLGVATRDDLRRGTVELLVRAWRGARKRDDDYSEYTRKSDRTFGRRLTDVIGRLRLVDVDDGTGGYLRRELRKKYAVGTTRATLAALVAIWKWALREGVVDFALDFSEEYRRLRETAKRGEATGARLRTTPEEDEAWAIADALEDGPAWAALAYRLLMMTGARIGEIATLRWTQVGTESIRVIGKTGPRQVYVEADALAVVSKARPAHAADEDRVLAATENTVKKHLGRHMDKAAARAGVRRITPHALRRFAVQRYIRRGVPPSVAAEQLGHTPEVMLRHYAKARRSAKVIPFPGARRER